MVTLFIGIYACVPAIEHHFLRTDEVQFVPATYEGTQRGNRNPCFQPINYAPDTSVLEHFPMKYVKVNFHFMNSKAGIHNYQGKEAIQFAKGLLNTANKDLATNYKMFLPEGNDTPVLPTQYRYKLVNKPDKPEEKAIYFHYDDEHCFYIHKGKNRNLMDRSVLNKYGVQKDTVLNIFVLPHHPDSVKSKTYNTAGVGVALGTYFKLAGPFETKKPYWEFKGLLNHEVGHIFTLAHTWRTNDGCDDTPKNPNCFNRNAGKHCDESTTSNNMMDYNAWQHAITPCQIGKMQLSMLKEKSRQRKMLEPTWCKLHEDRHIYIREVMDWNCMKDLEGHLTIEKGASLTMRCRVSLPKNAKITVKAGGKLILDNCRLHNSCGDQWEGIQVETVGNQKGEVIFMGSVKLENVKNELAPLRD